MRLGRGSFVQDFVRPRAAVLHLVVLCGAKVPDGAEAVGRAIGVLAVRLVLGGGLVAAAGGGEAVGEGRELLGRGVLEWPDVELLPEIQIKFRPTNPPETLMEMPQNYCKGS